jgi:hypothetical protein
MADPKFQDWGILVDNLEDGIKLATRQPKYRVRMQFSSMEQFEMLCYFHVKRPHGAEVFWNSLIAVDELAFFCSSAWIPPNLTNVIRLGRHNQARFIATTQRPPDINTFIRSQAKEQYLFQMHEPGDLDYFRKRIPNVEQLTQLKRGQYILWTPDNQQLQSENSSLNSAPSYSANQPETLSEP